MKVYVKVKENGCIYAVGSTMTINDTSDWTEIDEGEGDRYNLAQSHYFPLPLTDDNGICRYKLADGIPVERTSDETAAELAAITIPPCQPTDRERLDALEAAVFELILGADA